MESLLERDDELALLEEVVRAAAGGRGALVLVGGEAGIGKTTLVRALRARAGARARFVEGACEPLSVPVPLAPVRDLGEAAGLAEDAFDGDDRRALARRLLDALTARAPAVAVIEDAHWADPATLDVVRLLARRVETVGVALLLTYRDDEVAANAALATLLGDLATRPVVRRVRLRPLSRAAVRELAEPAGADATRVAQVSGGNPFLVVEAIAAGERIPASVRDAALARVGRLTPAARAAVDAAAAIGGRVEPRLLEAVAPGSATAVEEALARGVLVADGAVLGFRHELIRVAIEDAIAPPRRAELHARVVHALVARPGPPDHARLAHHAELAGLLADAAAHAAAASAEAERLGALRETSLQARRALRLGGAELATTERFELLLRDSRAANFASTRLEDAVESAQAAVELALALRDPVREGRGLVALAWALWSADRLVEAKAAAERAVAVLDGGEDGGALARARATDVRMAATAFDPADALAAGPRALASAERAGLEETRVDVAISVGLARGHRGEPAALALLEDALAAARAAGLAIQTVRAYVNLVFVGTTLREHALVERLVPEALALFDEYHATIPGNAVALYRARSLLDRGRWEEAHPAFARSDRKYAAEAPVARALAGLVAVRRGDPGGARLLEQAWEELAPLPESSRHAMLRVALLEAAWLRDDRGALRRELAAAAGSPATARFARWAGELAVWAARCGFADAIAPPSGASEAVGLEVAGDWRGAVRAWREADAPYEAALAALPGDERAAREALATLRRLGAEGAARAFARERAARGAAAPRGPRRSTLAHPAGLTRREQQVLEQLVGGATNAAIAQSLQLSERTVAHHVSAILGKLGVANRLAAVEAARDLGLLAQDGQAGGAR